MSSTEDTERDPEPKTSVFVAYWDCLGFECIINVSDYDKKAMWAALKGQKSPTQLALGPMLMRARANGQRSPEIWTFTSEIDLATLRQYSIDSPQELADAIRRVGKPIYQTLKIKQVIV